MRVPILLCWRAYPCVSDSVCWRFSGLFDFFPRYFSNDVHFLIDGFGGGTYIRTHRRR
ncbi:hypothetical protein SXCC_04071 [Gluconacetobacter sp. SXCC-1]|nr:hypothetical protein SXCC_04071 [Gluconacetobacter sp. SXCC-1]